MTNGTKTWDQTSDRSYTVTYCAGTGILGSESQTIKVGRYGSKTWSGSNSTSTRIPPTYKTYTYPIYDKHGNLIRVLTRRHRVTPTRFVKQLSENPYSCTIVDRVALPGTTTQYCGKKDGVSVYATRVLGDSHLNGLPDTSLAWSANEDIALLGRLRNQLHAEFNLATFLGEGKQALGTIAFTATRILRSFYALKRGHVLDAASLLVTGNERHRAGSASKAIAKARLEYAYAVKPLLTDVFNATEHLAYLASRPRVKKYVAHMSRNVPWEEVIRSGSTTTTDRGSVRVSKRLAALVTHVDEAKLLGLSDPRATAWELVPYSFVADWFIPIGNYLEALALVGSLDATYVTSTKTVQDHTYYLAVDESFGVRPYRQDEVWGQNRVTTVTRSVSNSLDVPRPTVRPLGAALSLQHAANAVALVVGSSRKLSSKLP